MKRKKFVKALMGGGMPRDTALKCAALAREAGRPYSEVFRELIQFHRWCFRSPLLLDVARQTIVCGHGIPPTKRVGSIDEMKDHLPDYGFYNPASWRRLPGLVAHHDPPIRPGDPFPGNVRIMTQEAHRELHRLDRRAVST